MMEEGHAGGKGRKGFAFSEMCLLHETGGHPESKGRLRAIVDAIEGTRFSGPLEMLRCRSASVDEVALNHAVDYIDQVKSLCEAGGGYLDPDTVVSQGSFEAAMWAVGCVLDAVTAVMDGRCSSVFCAVRPPGHHALRSRGMGFCLFNNVAIAAKYARKRGIGRVLIVDWDAHHGNGTQEAFYEDPTVFYFSTHQSPLYPGTGMAHETGKGPGLGYTLNCPLSPGSGDEEFCRIYDEVFLPKAHAFRPELILISAGYDSHRLDPLASLRLSTQGFQGLASRIAELSKEVGAPIVAVLEGGYNLSALRDSVIATIEAFP